MAWKVIAQADTSEGLQNAIPKVKTLEKGTIGRVAIEGLPSIAARLIFDSPGAEQTIGELLVPADARVIDCHEENGIGYIDFEVTGTPVIPLLLAIAAALIALGITVALITVSIKVPEALPWLLISMAILGALIIAAAIYFALRRK